MKKFQLLGLAVCALAASLLLAGCGDKEPEQRKAFIEVLQKNVVNGPKMGMRTMSDVEKKACGQYAEHFEVLPRIIQLSKQVGSLTNENQKRINSMQRESDPLKRKEKLDETAASLVAGREQLQKDIAEIDAAKAALKQPDDLKAVYDQAYGKLIAPANVTVEMLQILEELVQKAGDINDLVVANPDKLSYQGATVMIKDASLEKPVNDALKAQNACLVKLQEAAKKLR